MRVGGYMGTSEEDGNTELSVNGSLDGEKSMGFRCLKCVGEISTWTKLTKHLDTSWHYSAACVECGKKHSYFGSSQPHRHEMSTKHRGFLGIFHERNDYKIDHPMVLTRDQYRCHCGTSFLCVLHLAIHLRDEHHNQYIPKAVKCLTCQEEGMLDEMAEHWTTKKSENRKGRGLRSKRGTGPCDEGGVPKDCEFEVEGFGVDQFLVPFPKRPPRSPNGSQYVILYQCPTCRLLFDEWADIRQHIEESNHVHGLPPALLRRRIERRVGLIEQGSTGYGQVDYRTAGNRSAVRYLKELLEVFADINDPAVRELLYRYAPTNKNVDPDDEEVFGYQCPLEECSQAFLTYGEFRSHMKSTKHQTECNIDPVTGKPWLPSWESNPYAFEVTFTMRQLVEVFGYRKCGECNRPYRPGEEHYHYQMHHFTEKIDFRILESTL
ncbi:hypothetical protein DPX39_110053900 [Trypanosoma brucei equiperdum]|uniref:C2H2-type domain-containing protein n=1 Tax=Trypanosoma brucei equiperdum TaxID=630700 RepID=A0A3L6KTC2_9TRYP|nr:hypothetical protein DPX39_110053900 [Trypanosoma brucei equiperdum]